MNEPEMTSVNVTPSSSAPKTKLYRLKKGKKHSVMTDSGIRHFHAGQIVALTESQARNWRDKFDPAPQSASATPIEKASVPKGQESEDQPDEKDDDDEEEDDGDEPDEGSDQPQEGELPAGDPDESPIARRRREKQARKARRAR